LHQGTEIDRWLSLIIFLIAASTDWLDGYLARKFNQITELGKFLDPLVDKLLVLAPLLALIEMDLIAAWGVFLILARELAIAGWRINPNLTGNSDIKGANWWGKSKTVSQIIARKIDKNLTKCKITNISNNLRRQIERMGLHFFS